MIRETGPNKVQHKAQTALDVRNKNYLHDDSGYGPEDPVKGGAGRPKFFNEFASSRICLPLLLIDSPRFRPHQVGRWHAAAQLGHCNPVHQKGANATAA